MSKLSSGWPDLLAKIILAIISVLLGANQLNEHNEHQAIVNEIAALESDLNSDGGILSPIDPDEVAAYAFQ